MGESLLAGVLLGYKAGLLALDGLFRVMFRLIEVKIQAFGAAAFVAEKFPCLLFIFYIRLTRARVIQFQHRQGKACLFKRG